MNAITALLSSRQVWTSGDATRIGQVKAEVGTALTQLRVRLKPDEEDVFRVLLAMLSMVQRPTPGVHEKLGQATVSLTNWSRGDLPIEKLLDDVERRTGSKFVVDDSWTLPVTQGSSSVSYHHR